MQNGWVWQRVMSDIGTIPAIGLRIAWWQHCKRNDPWRRNRQGNFVCLKIGNLRLSVLGSTWKKSGRRGQTADNRNSVRKKLEGIPLKKCNATDFGWGQQLLLQKRYFRFAMRDARGGSLSVCPTVKAASSSEVIWRRWADVCLGGKSCWYRLWGSVK